MVDFNKNGAYFQTTKINFVVQIWTCFDLLLNHTHQTKLWSSQSNSFSRTDNEMASDFSIYGMVTVTFMAKIIFP